MRKYINSSAERHKRHVFVKKLALQLWNKAWRKHVSCGFCALIVFLFLESITFTGHFILTYTQWSEICCMAYLLAFYSTFSWFLFFKVKKKFLKDDLSLQSTKLTAYKKELLRQRCLNCRYSHNSSPSYQDLFPEYVLLQRVWLGCDGVLSNLNPVENLLIQSKFFLVPNYYPFRFSRQHVWVPEMKRNFSSIHICRWLERQKRHSF